MQKRSFLPAVFVFIVTALPFVYLAYLYPTLPSSVPTHFGVDGKPNEFHAKSFLWIVLSITGAMSVLLYFLMRFLPKIDPKKTAKYSAASFNKIGLAVVLLLCFINFMIIAAAQEGRFAFTRALPVLIGIFFVFMGNLMPSIKPNYFAGIRTPWTLESEAVWRKTHQLAGKLWFAGGLLIIALTIILPASIAIYALAVIALPMGLIPVAYSYYYYKHLQKINPELNQKP